MRTFIAAGLSCLCLAGGAFTQDRHWIAFKTGRNDCGRVAHQIDLQSIRPQGAYRIFWARIWLEGKHQPLMVNRNEALFALSRKYVVDCAGRCFGNRFVDSNDPSHKKRLASLKTMHWESLDKVPVVAGAVFDNRP